MIHEEMEKMLVQSRPFTYSLELLESLHAAGYAIVPIQPTIAMLESGARASEMSLDTVSRIYRTMLLAAGSDKN